MSVEVVVVLVVALLAIVGSTLALLAAPTGPGGIAPWVLSYAESEDPERAALAWDWRLHVGTLSEGFWY